MLERCDCGGTVLTYYRVFLYGNGVFKYEQADYLAETGEKCDMDKHREGTWDFKEGWTYPERGGGVAVKISVTANGTTGDDVLLWNNQDASHVGVGPQVTPFEINPNIRDRC